MTNELIRCGLGMCSKCLLMSNLNPICFELRGVKLSFDKNVILKMISEVLSVSV